MPHGHENKHPRKVLVKFRRPPTHINGVHHPEHHMKDWTKLPFLEGYYSQEFPNMVLLPTVAALQEMVKVKGADVARYWDEFDVRRNWKDERLDGKFAFPIHGGVIRLYGHH